MQPVDGGKHCEMQFFCDAPAAVASLGGEHQLGSRAVVECSDSPHFIFTPTGRTACAFTRNRLHCRLPDGREVSWSPTAVADNLNLVSAAFLTETSLVALLAPEAGGRTLHQRRSVLCIVQAPVKGSGKSILTRTISLRVGRATALHVISSPSRDDHKPIFTGSIFAGLAAVAFECGAVTLVGRLKSN